MNSKKIHIGTSGWNYNHWKGPFYERDLKAEDYLDFYKKNFDTVEINNSFYQLPTAEAIKNWKKKVPKSFVFSLKASRYITHMKKLSEPGESLKKFFSMAEQFGPDLGPVLFQLPPRWKCNKQRLKEFFEVLPDEYRYTFEFRDRSWINQEIMDILNENNAAFCIYEIDGSISPKNVTADFVYIRLHGPEDAYQGDYDQKTLSGWAGAISAWSQKNLDVFCYFDNDQSGYAPKNAKQLKNMLEDNG
jgi:uncharacterized protein YecE (DUF72 family)